MSGVPVTIVGEGSLDLAVLRRLLRDVGLEPGPEYGRQGKHRIDQQLKAYNQAARHYPWVVLRDLDRDRDCPGQLVADLLPQPSKFMILRIAVRTIESWLLSDADGFATAFAVPARFVPAAPEAVGDPKTALLNTLSKSTNRVCRMAMMRQAPAGGFSPGPEYNTLLEQFAHSRWQPDTAERRSISLAKARLRIQELADKMKTTG